MDLFGLYRSSNKYPVPYSCFVTLQIGNMILGNELLSPIKDPQAITSFSITRLNINKNKLLKRDEKGKINTEEFDTNKDVSGETTDLDNEAERFITNELLFQRADFGLSTIQDIHLEKRLLDFIKNSSPDAEVYFRYGFVNGPRSPKYSGIISKLEMSSDMYTLRMSISSSGLSSKYNKFTEDETKKISDYIEDNNKRKRIKVSDIVKLIADLKKWDIGKIQETSELNSIDEPIDNTDTPLTYLNKLRKLASKDKSGGDFRSTFRFDKKKEIKYYFVPSDFLENGEFEIIKDYNFFYNSLPNGVVQDFTPVLTDYIAYRTRLNNNNNKDNQEKVPEQAENIFGVISSDTKELAEGSYKFETAKAASGVINPMGSVVSAAVRGFALNSKYADIEKTVASVIKDDISSYVFNTAMNARASMTVIGDPDLQILDCINVLPMYPAKSILSGGIMHPSGGTYQIIKIRDSIQGGMYNTSLELVKLNKTMKLSELRKGPNTGKK